MQWTKHIIESILFLCAHQSVLLQAASSFRTNFDWLDRSSTHVSVPRLYESSQRSITSSSSSSRRRKYLKNRVRRSEGNCQQCFTHQQLRSSRSSSWFSKEKKICTPTRLTICRKLFCRFCISLQLQATYNATDEEAILARNCMLAWRLRTCT